MRLMTQLVITVSLGLSATAYQNTADAAVYWQAGWPGPMIIYAPTAPVVPWVYYAPGRSYYAPLDNRPAWQQRWHEWHRHARCADDDRDEQWRGPRDEYEEHRHEHRW